MKARVVEVDAAHALSKRAPIPNLYIKIRRRAIPKTGVEVRKRDKRQALQIYRALWDSLPVSTWEALKVLMQEMPKR